MEVTLPNNWTPRQRQLKAWSYLEKGGNHCELVWHRRYGKDELCLRWTSTAVFRRPGNYWHMLPQANQARKALWKAINPHSGIRRIDEAFPKEIRQSTNDTEMMVTFKNGSTWQVVGSDNFNSLVGSPPIGLVFSEWPLCDPASWAYLMPIIEENNGWAIFNGTPRGRNHAYRSLRTAQKSSTAFGEILSADQTKVFTQAQLDRILTELQGTYGEEYGLSVFEQEYLCSFEAANLGAILGRALAKAERSGRVDNCHAYDPMGAPLEISSDIGRRDASSWWFWQPCVGGYRIVDHDVDSGLDADEWCDRLQKRCIEKKYRLGKIWLPDDARAKTFSAKHSGVEIFLMRFGVEHVGVTPKTSREHRINAARRVIQHTAFHKDNTERGRDGLSAWCYVYDEERREFSKEPDHNWASHDGDGFSYGALVLEEYIPKPSEKENERAVKVFENTATLNDLWDTPREQSWRI